MALTKITGDVIATNTSITAVGATFTGNVSIAGTISYEDVTNVDSVGLITARSGINITSGGLIVTGVSTVSAGSTSAPSISPSGDTNTGIFFPSADTIAFGEGGSEVARFDSNGRLGIGTNNPGDVLHVAGTIRTSSGASNAQFANNFLRSNQAGTFYFDQNSGSQDFQFRVSNLTELDTTAMTIKSSGRIGIGVTSSVDELLHLKGGSAASTTVKVESTATAAERSSIHFFNGSISRGRVGGSNDFDGLTLDSSTTESAAAIRFRTGGASLTTKMTLTSGGSLGIGTTSPGDKLQIGDYTSSNIVRITSSTSGSGSIFFGDGSTGNDYYRGYVQYSHSDDSLQFGSAAGEAARFDSARRLLVGTSTAFDTANTGTSWLAGIEKPSGYSALSIKTNEASANGAYINLGKSRGTTANSKTIVNDNDELGGIYFEGADGASMRVGARIAAFVDGTPGANDLPTRLVFSTTADGASSPTERMRIGQQGFTKISSSGGYYSTSGTYHELRSTTDNSEILLLTHGGTSGTQYGITLITNDDQNDATRWIFKGRGGATDRFVVRSNGGIANYSANNVNLSDRNSKKDIAPAAGTWNCLKEWEIVNFRYKDQPDDADLNMGVIAQQVAESCPEVITVFQEAKEATETEPAQEERLGVKDQQMMWMAIKALQEAQTRIESLESQNSDLLARITALES